MDNWKIRIANHEDVEQLESCMQGAYSVYKDRMGNQTLPPLQIDYAAEIDNFPTWVAELDGKIVGGLIMCFEDDHPALSNIAVDPKFQGHGLGRGLMNFAETQAKEHGFAKLHLATHVLLTENVALYKHLGWNQLNKDDTRVFFEKVLS